MAMKFEIEKFNGRNFFLVEIEDKDNFKKRKLPRRDRMQTYGCD